MRGSWGGGGGAVLPRGAGQAAGGGPGGEGRQDQPAGHGRLPARLDVGSIRPSGEVDTQLSTFLAGE